MLQKERLSSDVACALLIIELDAIASRITASECFYTDDQFIIKDYLYAAEFSFQGFPLKQSPAMSNLSVLFVATCPEYVTADIPTCTANEDNYLRVARKIGCKKIDNKLNQEQPSASLLQSLSVVP